MSSVLLARSIAAVVTAVAIGAAASACGSANHGNGSSSDTATITAISSQTGPGAPYGKMMTKGSQLGVAKVNSTGGVGGKQIELNTEDDGSDAATAVTLVQKAAPQSNVVLFNTLSSVAAQAAPAANDLQLPVIGPAISTPNVVVKNRPYIFSTFPKLATGISKAIQTWHSHEDVSSAAMIVDTQNKATKSQANLYKSALKSSGTTLTQSVAVATQDVNFGAAVQRALRGSPDGIVVSALPEQAGSIVRAVRNEHPDISLFLPTAAFVKPTLDKVAGTDALAGVYTVQTFFGGKGTSVTAQKFVSRFKKKYSMSPDSTAAFAYEEMLLLQQAAKDGAYMPGDSSQDARDKLRDYLAKLDWQGPFGRVVMGENGIVQRDLFVLRVDAGGEPELVETVTSQ